MFRAAVDAPLYEDSVILMHDATRYAPRDDCDSTVEVIPRLVGLLRARGYDFGPLTAPIAARPQRPGEEILALCDHAWQQPFRSGPRGARESKSSVPGVRPIVHAPNTAGEQEIAGNIGGG